MIAFNQLSLETIIEGYEQELQMSREEEVGYGFELYRRAIEEHNQLAWAAIYKRHHGLIHNWIQVGTSQILSTYQKEDLIQEAWFKFYRNITKYGSNLAQSFKHVGALFNYLKKCVFSVILDYQRHLKKQRKIKQSLAKDLQLMYLAQPPQPLSEHSTAAQTKAVKEWLSKNITDPQEKLIMSCSYQLNMTPRDIYKRYPDKFEDVRRVYRIKERILRRARRTFELSTW